MKASFKQKEICDFLEKIIDQWKNSDDINSITLQDIEEIVSLRFDGNIHDYDVEDISNFLYHLYLVIKHNA